ncbi:MAG: ribonuclease E/G [bacterium]
MPGRYLVIMPPLRDGGVSRKIQDEETRKRLKDLIEKLGAPEDMGIIVRTAGDERSKELQADFQELVRVWGHPGALQPGAPDGPHLPRAQRRHPVGARLLHR